MKRAGMIMGSSGRKLWLRGGLQKGARRRHRHDTPAHGVTKRQQMGSYALNG